MLLSLTLLSGAVLSAPKANADTSATVDLTVDVPTACSLTPANTNLVSTINPGTNGEIGTANIKAVCNDPNGFAIYAVGYTDEEYGNNYLTTTLGEDYKIATGNVVSPSTSQWNMTIGIDSTIANNHVATIENQFEEAHEVPETYTKIASLNSTTDQSIGANLTSTFNAYIAPNQAAGTYTGKVKFLLVHPNVLTWQEDSQNPGTMIPDDEQPATLACEPAEYDTFDPSVTHYLQDVAQWENQVALEQEVTAYDRRDNQAYKVKRLKMSADGCQTALWMSNLNLGAETLTVSTLDSSNTNLPSNGNNDIDVATTFNSWIKSSGTGSFTTPELVPLKSSNTCLVWTEGSSSTVSCPEQDSYGNKYGTLYNYAAASAGTYIYADGAGTGNAQYDLCPSGWRLPTGRSTGEFQKLTIDAYDLYDMSNDQWNTGGFISIQQTLGFSLAGRHYIFEPDYQGLYGYYWSSTFGSGDYMYNLSFHEGDLYPDAGHGRNTNLSVRCIAQ